MCTVIFETTVCGYYHGNCRELSSYILHLVQACGSNVLTTKSLFFALMHQKFASSCFSLGHIKLLNVTFKELL